VRSSLVVTDSLIWTAETEYALSVAVAEAGMGADVTLAAPVESAAAENVPSTFEFVALPGPEPSRSVADFVADTRVIAGVIERTRPSVVHSSRSSAHLMCALATGSRSPLVHLRGGAARPSRGPANGALYRNTAAVITSSSRVRRWVVEDLRVPQERVHRLLSPIDTFMFDGVGPADLKEEFGLAPGARVLLNVARLAPVKGHYVLLDAFARVAAHEPGAVLLLVGEAWSGEPEGLRARAVELGVADSVVFAGRRDDVPALISASEVCVTSSVGSEENSRAVSEYMAGGKPVVATTVGVIPELVVDCETGYLVPPREADPMAEAVLTLMRDRERAVAMGAAGAEIARSEFSLRAFVDGLGEALGSVGVSL